MQADVPHSPPLSATLNAAGPCRVSIVESPVPKCWALISPEYWDFAKVFSRDRMFVLPPLCHEPVKGTPWLKTHLYALCRPEEEEHGDVHLGKTYLRYNLPVYLPSVNKLLLYEEKGWGASNHALSTVSSMSSWESARSYYCWPPQSWSSCERHASSPDWTFRAPTTWSAFGPVTDGRPLSLPAHVSSSALWCQQQGKQPFYLSELHE